MKPERFELELEYCDVKMIIEGDYYEGAKSNDYDVPDDEPMIDIEHIWVDSQDVSGLIAVEQFQQIEDEIYWKLV